MMTFRLPLSTDLQRLHNFRDLTCWLEGAGPVPVHIVLMELEAAPVRAVVAAAAFVGIRRRLQAEYGGANLRDGDLTGLRSSLTLNAQCDEGLADDCLELIAREAAGRPMDALAERLYESHGLHAVLALASFAKALGGLLVEPHTGFPSYNELYFAELALMSGRPYQQSASGAAHQQPHSPLSSGPSPQSPAGACAHRQPRPVASSPRTPGCARWVTHTELAATRRFR